MIELFKPNAQEGYAPMTRRLATMCLLTLLVIGVPSPVVQADDGNASRKTLGGLTSVSVIVDSPDSEKLLGLPAETIHTDVELKLRLAGLRVMTPTEIMQVPGSPILHVSVTVANDSRAAHVEIELDQDARLEQNGLLAATVSTWSTGGLDSNPTGQSVRDHIKDLVDKFLNAWLSVNPKK
jgi:hypothetical protein